MTKKEFENYIDKCSTKLWVEVKNYSYGDYLCFILNDGVYDSKQLIEFKNLMTENDIDGHLGVFGHHDYFENQAQRFIMLYLFEQYCIDNELYKHF